MHQLLAPVTPTDQPILNRARQIYADRFGEEITSEVVRNLNRQFGTDLATAILYVHFEMKLLASDRPFAVDVAGKRPLLIAVSPGAFYREHPEVGADGRELLELCSKQSWRGELIPARSLGTLQENAEIINEFLERWKPDYRVVLVSLSKGTADAQVAQSLRPNLFAGLAAWISVSGMSHGTMMSDWLLEKWYLRPILKLMLWRHGVDRQTVDDLRYCPEQPIGCESYDSGVPMIHVAGFPLQQHLSCRRARLWYRRFKGLGPNDSVIMLEDLLRLPGTIIPVWGADHYLQSVWNAPQALTRLIGMMQHRSNQNTVRADSASVTARA